MKKIESLSPKERSTANEFLLKESAKIFKLKSDGISHNLRKEKHKKK